MTAATKTKPVWQLSSVELLDAWTDFILSRQAMNCAPATLQFYRFTLGIFLPWCERQGITTTHQVTARLVRQYLAELAAQGKEASTIHAHARTIRTLLRFWHKEKYIPEAVTFAMPKLAKKRLPVLTAEELQRILKVLRDNIRDKAIVMFMADSGLRRAETIALNWADVDIQSGLVRVRKGKGRKDRSAVIGARTRRALLAYRRTLVNRDGVLFQTDEGERFSGNGMLAIFIRIQQRTGIHVTPHVMRRTFVILSLRSGMNVLVLQNLLGHEDLTMTRHYAQMVDDDLLAEHKAHSPVDSLR